MLYGLALLEISRKSSRKIWAGDLFTKDVDLWKAIPSWIFFGGFSRNFQNFYSNEHLRTATSA